jgi:hypothetical protein
MAGVVGIVPADADQIVNFDTGSKPSWLSTAPSTHHDRVWNFGHWELFGIWDLNIGIFTL